MTDFKLSDESLDRLTVDMLRRTRRWVAKDTSQHPEDVLNARLRVAACDVLLAYFGEAAE